MLVAPKKPAGPEWVPVMGASVLFAPIDRPLYRRARRAALKALGRKEEPETEADAVQQLEELGDALSEALIMEGARDWRDVGQQRLDDAGGEVLDAAGKPIFEALEFSRENLLITLSDPLVFQAFDEAYVIPFAARERAKNGSAVSPIGTGEAATPGSNIVSSPARQPKARAATSARTPSKKPRTKKPKSFGKS